MLLLLLITAAVVSGFGFPRYDALVVLLVNAVLMVAAMTLLVAAQLRARRVCTAAAAGIVAVTTPWVFFVSTDFDSDLLSSVSGRRSTSTIAFGTALALRLLIVVATAFGVDRIRHARSGEPGVRAGLVVSSSLVLFDLATWAPLPSAPLGLQPLIPGPAALRALFIIPVLLGWSSDRIRGSRRLTP